MHVTQVLELESEYFPPMQSMHTLEPGMDVYCPASHTVHVEAPVNDEDPSGQFKQAENPVLENLPEEHDWHDVALAVEENFPDEHCVQLEAGDIENVPAKHCMHDVAAEEAVLANPEAHAVHTVTALLSE